MNVLVFGASGFLGSWIVRILAKDHNVSCVVRPSSNLFNLQGISGIEIVVCEPKNWEHQILIQKPEVMILADWWGVGSSQRNDKNQHSNTSRHLQLAKAAVVANVNRIIGVGSQAELGQVNDLISETLGDNPTTEYAKAKIGTRIGIQRIVKGSETKFNWIRIFSTYGPLDIGNWLIPNAIRNLGNGLDFDMTLGEQNWSYLHCYDLAKAFQKVIESDIQGGIINAGNPETAKIKDVARLIKQKLESAGALNFGAVAYRADQVMNLKVKSETLLGLGWCPEILIDQGIEQTIDWLCGRPEKPLFNKANQAIFFQIPQLLL